MDGWLLAACDPQTGPSPPLGCLRQADLERLIEAAERHAVLGAVLRSLARWQAVASPFLAAERATCEQQLQAAQTRLLQRVGRTLGLRQIAVQALAALAAQRIPCCILKGQDFADRLYPDRSLRTYSDVDVLVPREAFGEADAVLRNMDFVPQLPERKYAAEQYGQISYLSAGDARWSLELHWNLINSPAQRHRCSLTWNDLHMLAPASAGQPHRLCPNSLMVLACVHACLGHRFDSLQQLCDIRQIARGSAGALDLELLADMSGQLRCGASLAWSLNLVMRLLGCPEAAHLAAHVSRWHGRGWQAGLFGRQTVLHPHRPWSKLRRACARHVLKYAA